MAVHVKQYIGHFFDEEKLKAYTPNYDLDDDAYEAAICYKVTLQSDYDEAPRWSNYYLEIIVGADNRVEKITRYLNELAFSSYERTRFPKALEEEAAEILNACIYK